MTNKDKLKDIKKIFTKKRIYIAAAALAFILGISGYIAGHTGNQVKLPEGITEGITYKNINEPISSVPEVSHYKIEIDIPEYTTKEAPTTAQVFENKAPEMPETKEKRIYKVPLSNSVGKDFSMGIPVFSKTMKDYRTHNGVDFMGVKGEEVCAIGDGKVTEVSESPLWGNTVTVDHGDGTVSRISGLGDDRLVKKGTDVYAGSVIGVVGTVPVEKEDPSHIHLEIRIDGSLADPLEVLGLTGE